MPFSHPSIKQGKYSFLAGPNVKKTNNKSEVLKILRHRLRKLDTSISLADVLEFAAAAESLEQPGMGRFW